METKHTASQVDWDSITSEAMVRELLLRLGEDPEREGLLDTPKRVVKAFKELTKGYKQNIGEILSRTFTSPYDEMIVVKDIPFVSLCEHHVLPFTGKVSVGYIPYGGKVIGLSKIPRLVGAIAAQLQIQERMTEEIAHALFDHPVLRPKGVAVIVEGNHFCMMYRGVKSKGTMKTSCLLGAMIKNTDARTEFLSLIKD